ncbi:bifunctional ADP-dependent NAD(P)H-hydrate dehydratase/NAD(P)H-hydrate epimerase [Nocardioides sp. C4-1]|uniref:bifunctional ADP-dependent NAD(P)H-hydrate dehydratase/NAD(P)H-hydrate epimerase n=1 Tax=Nocardioides sp. C4-1 TaxID=3151851 RepID=UPI00326758B3
MRQAHTVEQVRAAETALMATLPDGVLMQRAATGLAHAVLDLLTPGTYGRRVVLLVGSGDNGGDALFAGAVLARRGLAVTAWLLADRVHDDGLAALRRAGGRTTTTPPATRPDLVVDGIVGIGGRAGLRPDAVAALEALRGVPLVAVDTPSGVDVDTGELPDDGHHVRADVTVTFGTHQVAHLVDPAARAAGVVHLVDIGLGPHLSAPAVEALRADDVAALLPRPAPDAQKYSRGVVGVRAGSERYPGAGLLSVAGASCGLAGMVRYVGDDAVLALVHRNHPEVVGDGRVQAWVVGSGSGDGAAGTLAAALDDGVPTVVDADALAHAPRDRDDAILTPHAGELAAMLDADRADVEARPLAHARRAADAFGCTVLLKGRRSLVVHPDGRVRANTTGTSWLATAGAGDVLGGVVGALAAAGLDPFDAAAVGAWLHGAAATHAARRGPITAGDVAEALPTVLGDVLRQSAS